jgi:cellulose synthase/poly-beta-1,6-N-acetylglucosamine synthase-like glycosyltransferase
VLFDSGHNFIVMAAAPLAVIWSLPLASDVLSAIKARRSPLPSRTIPNGRTQQLLFLVPAHNESTLIQACVRSLVQMRQSAAVEYTVAVVADNCTDDTVSLAHAEGVRVLVRHAPNEPGKPRAIQWALDQFDLERWDAVVIIDADTIVAPDFAGALAGAGPLREKAVQAYFGVSNRADSWLSLLADLLANVRYEGQYPLKRRAGINCPLTGNGMCLGTGLLERAGWDTESLTENWELYARYTALGEQIDYAADAKLFAQEAHTLKESTTQRRRWQAGRWSVLMGHWRDLLRGPDTSLHQALDAVGELASPGPVQQATIALGAAMALFVLPGRAATAVALLYLLGVVPIAWFTIRAWWRHPKRRELLGAFVRVPVYAVWRIGVGLLAISTARSGVWQRSPRHTPGRAAG